MSDCWVLLRGWSREARHWGGFPRQLSGAMAGARVVAVDLPGNGEMNALASPTRVEAMVDAARGALRDRAIAGPYHLLGMSLGAMACIDWAARHGGEVRGAVLVNTSARPFSPFHQRLRPRSALALAWLALAGRDPRGAQASILRLTSAGGDDAVVDDWVRIAAQRPVTRTNALRQLLAAARFRAPDRPPAVPLLLLASACDRLVDPECSRRLARRWNVPLAVHPTAGHDLALDDGPWVAAQVASWFRPT